MGVAVSGGKDSLSLLKILHELNAGSNSELVALTVDEALPVFEAVPRIARLGQSDRVAWRGMAAQPCPRAPSAAHRNRHAPKSPGREL